MLKLSKFYGIKFPIFCLRKAPFNVRILMDKIYVQKEDSSICTLIDSPVQDKNAPFLHRYIQTKDDEFHFDFTCNNITALINKSKVIKWGIDSSGKIFNLNSKQTFKARCVRITKVKGNLVWFDTVTYPFKLKSNMIDEKLLKEQYAIVVYIDKEWVLHKFINFYEPINEIIL